MYPSEKDWWTWLRKNGVEDIDPDSGLQFDSYDMALNTAIQGHGIALGMEPIVTCDLRRSRILRVFFSVRETRALRTLSPSYLPEES